MAPAINPCRKALEYAQADATAAHVALMSTELGTSNPSSSRGERQALSVLLAARRSAVNASTEAQLQVFSLVIAAPEPIRVRSRGQKLAAMLNTAATLRVQSAWDVETTSTVVALRTLARRAHAMLKEARELQGDGGHHPQLAPRPPRGVRRR